MLLSPKPGVGWVWTPKRSQIWMWLDVAHLGSPPSHFALFERIPVAFGPQIVPVASVPPSPLRVPPGPSSVYQIEDANEDTIGVLVRLITEKKGLEG